MRNANTIIYWAKELKTAKTKEKEESMIYKIRCAVDEYEDQLIVSEEDES